MIAAHAPRQPLAFDYARKDYMKSSSLQLTSHSRIEPSCFHPACPKAAPAAGHGHADGAGQQQPAKSEVIMYLPADSGLHCRNRHTLRRVQPQRMHARHSSFAARSPPTNSTLYKIITYHSGNHCSNQRRGRSHGVTFRLIWCGGGILSHTSAGERISVESAIRERDSWEESTDGAKALEQGAVTYRAGTTPSFVFVYSG